MSVIVTCLEALNVKKFNFMPYLNPVISLQAAWDILYPQRIKKVEFVAS